VAKSNTAGTASGYVLSLLRIVAGALYTEHGLQLTFGLFGGHRFPLTSFTGIGGLLEVIGGVLLILGAFTRPVALVLCGEMAVAYFRVHAPHGTNPLQNSGELAVLYCFLFLYLIFAGGGTISVDRFRGRN
jgi:putative oxidoreductase